MTPTPSLVDARGLKLRLWDHGGPGRPVLFAHGYLDTGRSFDDVAALLQPDVRALCLDLRGHGQTEPVGPGGSHHLLDHVKDLFLAHAALQARGLAPEVTVGHSMGGNVALLLAGSRPERVRRLLLVDTLGAPAEAPADQPARIGDVLSSLVDPPRPFPTFSSVEEAAERIRKNNPGLPSDAALRMARHALRPADDDPTRLTFAFDPRLKGPTPVRWPEETWLALCARVTAPVVVVRAENGYVPDDEAARARAAALRARMVSAPGGHHVHVEDPSVIAEAVRALLASS